MWKWLKLFRINDKSINDLNRKDVSELLDLADRSIDYGDRVKAIKILQRCLELDPSNVRALNNIGVCYLETGEEVRGHQAFELAQSLDDDFPAGVINRAKVLVDQKKSVEALSLIRHVSSGHPNFHHVNAVYGSLAFNRGRVSEAKYYHLRAWLGDFNSLRHANCYLFESSYDAIDELRIGAEHEFWASTLSKNISTDQSLPVTTTPIPDGTQLTEPAGRIRIAYWTPDLYNHSIRYFLRPLLANHDRDIFEILLIQDHHRFDEQTDAMKASADRFYNVYNMGDHELIQFLKSLKLDILVELSGHSSLNRLHILDDRIAKLQLSALGYPPTSGLTSIDAKIIDRHVSTPDDAYYYTEYPAPLSSSFWCFDPAESAVIDYVPPVVKNGHITFACVGNISKINSITLYAWSKILILVPSAILVIRSVSFEDEAARTEFEDRFIANGFDIGRVRLLGPLAGSAFFSSYNDIDIVLDTYPFNGGTTTCFATYMGVPVVSLSGSSLISRMGLSILTNLGIGHLCTSNVEDYINITVKLSQDIDFLKIFRREARLRYKATPLGNGELYAKDFESICKDLLNLKTSGHLAYRSKVPALPANEIIKRAYKVLGFGNKNAARRIVAYAALRYPESASVCVLQAQLLADDGNLVEATDLLSKSVGVVSKSELISVLITLVRYQLLLQQYVAANITLSRLRDEYPDNDIDRVQISLYEGRCQIIESACSEFTNSHNLEKSVGFFVISNHESTFQLYLENFTERIEIPEGMKVEFINCDPHKRHDKFRLLSKASYDIVIICHPHVEIFSRAFLRHAASLVDDFDLVGFSGCDRWVRCDWRDDDFQRRNGCYSVPTLEAKESIDLIWSGVDSNLMVPKQAVLDGGLLIARPEIFTLCQAEPSLQIDHPIYEEFLSYIVSSAGRRVGVCRELGVLLKPLQSENYEQLPAALRYVASALDLDPFNATEGNNLSTSVPIPDIPSSFQIIRSVSVALKFSAQAIQGTMRSIGSVN